MTAPVVETGNLVTNPVMPGRNGGTLKRGGSHHNSGRKPAAIRKKALRMLADRLELVGHLADGVAVEFEEGGAVKLVSPKPGERLQALKLLAELGMGQQVGVGEVRSRLAAQVEVLRQELDAETFARVAAKLGEIWR